MNTTSSFLGAPRAWKDAQVHVSALHPLWGGWQVFVSGRGLAVVQEVSRTGQELRYRLALPEAEVRSLLDACATDDLLAAPPPQRPGIADELMLVLTLVNGQGERRQVQKWSRDRQPVFEAVARPLFELIPRRQEVQPYYTGTFTWRAPTDPPLDPFEGLPT